MMRKVLAMALLTSLLVGCSGRPATPPAGSPAPAPAPAPVTAKDDACASTEFSPPLQIRGNFSPRNVQVPGGCRFVVDAGPLSVEARSVVAPTAAAARAALQVTGATEEWPANVTPSDPDSWYVTWHLQGGGVGETIELKFRSAPDAEPLPVTLVRKASPTIQVSIAGPDGAWAPLIPGSSLPPGPKRLRFQATGGISLGFLAKAFHTGDWFQAIKPDRISQVADDVAEVAFDNPPPLVVVNLGGVGTDGLGAQEQSSHFYTGAPPELLVVDKDGHRTRIGAAPPEIWTTTVRADGRYAALQTLIPEQIEGVATWLVDLRTGKLTRTPFTYSEIVPPGFDARGRLVAPLDHGRLGILTPESGDALTLPSTANHWEKISPDGRYSVGRSGDAPYRSIGAWVGPPRSYQLIIRDLQTNEERVYPWDPQGPAIFGTLEWLPDGRLLQQVVQQPRESSLATAPENQWHSYLVDLPTGRRTPDEGKQEPAPAWPSADPPAPDEKILATLPDGRKLLLHWANLSHARGWPPP